MGHDKTIELFNSKPSLRKIPKDASGRNCLRSYHSAPGEVTIQIRMENQYAVAHLSTPQARIFAQYILDACADDVN